MSDGLVKIRGPFEPMGLKRNIELGVLPVIHIYTDVTTQQAQYIVIYYRCMHTKYVLVLFNTTLLF